MEFRIGGIAYTFEVERVLCSAESLATRAIGETSELRTFQLFVPEEERFNESYRNGETYLIFIKRIASDDRAFSLYRLDNTRTYYRAYENEKSIFPASAGLHGSPTKGILRLSNSRFSELRGRIEAFCESISGKGIESKVTSLRKLTKSSDLELRENAEYAIQWLENDSKYR
jgi:hypothetical protein